MTESMTIESPTTDPHTDKRTFSPPTPAREDATVMPMCRFCGQPLTHTLVDLGKTPLCESFLTEAELAEPEMFYPLRVYVCGQCWLVQQSAQISGEHIFGGNYAYFSSFSDSWLKHCENYVEQIINRLGLGPQSHVIEVASNDGYLLQYFMQRDVPVLGIEPARNCAKAADDKGVPTRVEFFGTQLGQHLADNNQAADLLIANNVLAHVPQINDFVEGFKRVLNPAGVITVEFPHLMRLMDETQFDTIYHEHFYYYSLAAVETIFAAHGLSVYDAEELPTHGGSLRIFATHRQGIRDKPTQALYAMRERECSYGMTTAQTYNAFAPRVAAVKANLLTFLIEARRAGKSVVGYGAPGKGNTLLNYCGIDPTLLAYTVDRNPYKHGKFTPGTHIPIFPPTKIAQTKPDYVLILPWNLKEEIVEQLSFIRGWGGQCVVPIPNTKVLGSSKEAITKVRHGDETLDSNRGGL